MVQKTTKAIAMPAGIPVLEMPTD